MEFPVTSHAFDGDDVGAIGLDCEHRARLYREPIRKHRACAANAGFAADVSSGELRDITDEVCQQKARFNVALVRPAVNGDLDVLFHSTSPSYLLLRPFGLAFAAAHEFRDILGE